MRNPFRPKQRNDDFADDYIEQPNLIDTLSNFWQWDELTAEVVQEGQARIAIVGLQNAGKSQFFNHLRGWNISPTTHALPNNWQIEPYGAFILADLPENNITTPEELLLMLGDPSLVLYLVDGEKGVQTADFRWVATFRTLGKPLVIALNKSDLLASPPQKMSQSITEAQQRLGVQVIPISAQKGDNIEEQLLPALLNAAPKLSIPLGREIQSLRRHAARRIIRQAMLFAGIMGAQPIPLLDLPFQVILQTGIILRIGSAYGHPPKGGFQREMLGAVFSVLSSYYLAETLLKFIPIIGSFAGIILSATGTLTIGEVAIRYYEADATLPLPQWLKRRRFRKNRPEEMPYFSNGTEIYQTDSRLNREKS